MRQPCVMCVVHVSVLDLQVSMRDDCELLYFTLLFGEKSFFKQDFLQEHSGGVCFGTLLT